MPKKNLYQKRVAQGLCVVCGKVEVTDKKRCPECEKGYREYKRMTYQTCMKRGICPVCHVNPIMGEERSCPECRAYRSVWLKEYPKGIEYNNKCKEMAKERYRKRKESGLCTYCGTKKAERGTKCNECYTMLEFKRKRKKS